jgi:CheY-like chemotaxis protein
MKLPEFFATQKYRAQEGRAAQKDRFSDTFDRFISAVVTHNIRPMKASRNFTGKLVVVIDDDHRVLDATSGLLRSWGFRVVTALDFDGALRQLAGTGRRPDLIVCDYRLSKGQTGVDAIEGLRCAFEIPAFLISGDASCPQSDQGRSGYQLLRKPLNAEALRAALLEACAPSP